MILLCCCLSSFYTLNINNRNKNNKCQQAFATFTRLWASKYKTQIPFNKKKNNYTLELGTCTFKTYKLQKKRHGFIKLKTWGTTSKSILFKCTYIKLGVCKYDSSSHFFRNQVMSLSSHKDKINWAIMKPVLVKDEFQALDGSQLSNDT